MHLYEFLKLYLSELFILNYYHIIYLLTEQVFSVICVQIEMYRVRLIVFAERYITVYVGWYLFLYKR